MGSVLDSAKGICVRHNFPPILRGGAARLSCNFEGAKGGCSLGKCPQEKELVRARLLFRDFHNPSTVRGHEYDLRVTFFPMTWLEVLDGFAFSDATSWIRSCKPAKPSSPDEATTGIGDGGMRGEPAERFRFWTAGGV